MPDHVVFPWLVPVVAVVLVRAFRRVRAEEGDRRLVLAVAAAALLMGVWQLEGALLPGWRAREARAWQSATGTVVYSQVTATTPGQRSTWRENFFANVGTEFHTAAGVLDTAWGVGLTRNPGTADSAEALASRYPVGTRVQIFYNPARPWEAAIVREAPPLSLIRVMLSAALLGGGLVLLVANRERQRSGAASTSGSTLASNSSVLDR